MSFLVRSFAPEIEVDDKSYRAIISTGRIDRYDSIIYPNGVDFSSYLHHPVLLFNHNPDLVSGQVIDLIRRESGIEARFVFDAEDPDAQRIKSKVDRGFISGMSIGFLPKKAQADKEGVLHIYESELVEVSVVSVPANPDALIMNHLERAELARLRKRIRVLERQLEQNAEELKQLAASLSLLKKAKEEPKGASLDKRELKEELKRILVTELKNILGRA